MKKQLIVIVVMMMLTIQLMYAQNEIPVPLTDPAKRGKLKAHINYGSITVKGTARKDVLVKYSAGEDSDEEDHDHEKHKDKKANKDGLKRISGGTLDLEISENANMVRVESGSWGNKVNLNIEVPSGMDLNVSTYNDGVLTISNIQGELELSNYNGEIYADNISGSVVATSYNGEIKVAFDKVTEGTPMSFSTFNGDIDLTFPATLKATLKMKTEQGEVLSSFDMNVVKNGPVQKKDTKSGVYKVVVDEWVKGEVNGGGPEFTMKNYNGDIIIRKK